MPTYDPKIFAVPDLEAAKRIILTPTPTQDTETRWERETPYLVDLIAETLKVRQDQLVIDYGCGIGRLAKALIERCGCRVLGVDISKDMRSFAPGYVDSPLFSVVSRAVFEGLTRAGLRADAAFAAWVLQHAKRPQDDIDLLARAMRSAAGFAVVNSVHRIVPTVEKGWTGDNIDVRKELTRCFELKETIALNPGAVGDDVAAKSFFAVYRLA